MTRHRIAAAVAALTLAAGLAVAAPDGGDRGGRGQHDDWSGQRDGGRMANPERLVERMTRHVDLDETQEQTVRNILEAAKPEFESLRERGRTNMTAMRDLDPADPDYSARLDDLSAENGQLVADGTRLVGRVRGEVYAVLTPEQIAELEAAGDRMRERFRRRRGNRE